MPDPGIHINIRETINSGQIFLWENYGNEWFVLDGDDIIMGKQTPFEVLTFSKRVKNFFRQDDNYLKILKEITKDKIVKKTAEEFNLPYHSKLSFIGALRLHGRFLKSLGRA